MSANRGRSGGTDRRRTVGISLVVGVLMFSGSCGGGGGGGGPGYLIPNPCQSLYDTGTCL